MDELVSVIIPVCNASGSLMRCVSSITGQTYGALQIILVDDGSSDGSGAICDALSLQDSRIEVVHRRNKGVSAARNTGLDLVRGEWIAFADADDYVAPYYVEDLYLAAVRDECGMAVCRHISVQENHDHGAPASSFRRTENTLRMTAYDACIRHFGSEADLFNTCWGKLFRAHLFTGLRYPEDKINEDLYLSHALLYRSGYVAVTDGVLYAYVQSGNSIMRRSFTPERLDVLDAWQESVRFYSKAGEADLLRVALRVYCSRVQDAQCICGRLIPLEHEVLRSLRFRAKEAYKGLRQVRWRPGSSRGYADCTFTKAIAYRFKLMLGRLCLPLYGLLFVRGRTYI